MKYNLNYRQKIEGLGVLDYLNKLPMDEGLKSHAKFIQEKLIRHLYELSACNLVLELPPIKIIDVYFIQDIDEIDINEKTRGMLNRHSVVMPFYLIKDGLFHQAGILVVYDSEKI
jgi:hypothetical protein